MVLRSEITRPQSGRVGLYGSLPRPKITMAAKKRKPSSLRQPGRPMPIISTTVGSLINLTPHCGHLRISATVAKRIY